MSKYKILVIDDNTQICKLMKKYGEKLYDYTIDTVQTIEDAFLNMECTKYDLITLDIELEDDSGLDRLCDIKKQFDGPILFVSCNTDVETIIEGLEKGADDYITKPFDLEELFLRIKRSLKRTTTYRRLIIENYIVDEIQNKVWLDNRELKLGQVATKILILLLKEKNNLLSREEIFAKIWSQSYSYSTRVIDTHVSYIRKETNDVRIRSVRSKGYIFVID